MKTRALALAVAAALLAAPAAAQQTEGLPPSCYPHVAGIANLATFYGEREVASALNSSGIAVFIYANETTGTWTALMVAPSRPDIACEVDSGTDWAITPGGEPS